MKKQVLDQKTLDDIIRRVVEVAQPERIILFGSAARGDMTRNSDVDLLIIKEGGDANLRARIYEKMYGVRVAVDAILVSPTDVERYKDSHALVIKPALQEGRVVYESAERFPPEDPRDSMMKLVNEWGKVRQLGGYSSVLITLTVKNER